MGFIEDLFGNPALLITIILTISVVLVNGWTDAPNAIATVVSTRSMTPRTALIMAALMNFLGVLVMTLVNKSVAVTITKMVDFGSGGEGLVALCAALIAIVLWAGAAWYFGIPTSESHALIAGLSGAAIAFHGGIGGINGAEWIKVIQGLALSTILGFSVGLVHGPGPAHPGRLRHSPVADGHGFRDHGFGYLHRWLPHHQGSGHGYGETGKIPGLCRRHGGSHLLIIGILNRDAGIHHPHENNGHHGGRGGPAAILRQLEDRGRYGPGLGSDLSRLRTHRLFNSPVIHADFLIYRPENRPIYGSTDQQEENDSDQSKGGRRLEQDELLF